MNHSIFTVSHSTLLRQCRNVGMMVMIGLVGLGNATLATAQNKLNVLMKTSQGDVTIELQHDKAPKSVENFLQYVRDGFYSNTIFHRVIDGFMVQGGGFTADMAQKTTRAPIPLESQNGLKNEIGTVAMARTSNPNSATAQFFINTVNNSNLNYPQPDGFGYAVFGKVVKGMDVIEKISKTPTEFKGMMRDVPSTPIVIQSITMIEPDSKTADPKAKK
jgi:peptidyl-prolyl cis-trans isomerase A (cyclophilin A)